MNQPDLRHLSGMLNQPGGVADVAACLAAWRPADPAVSHLFHLLRSICEGADIVPAEVTAHGSDTLFLDNIRQVVTNRQASHRLTVPLSGPMDFLQHRCDPSSWTLMQVVNLLAMRSIKPRRKVAAVLLARNEGIVLIEWLAHYAALGIEKVFVYCNGNTDGSDCLLDQLSMHGLVTVLRDEVTRGVNPQLKSYQHALHFLHELREYEWALFVDADEFLVLSGHHGHDLPQLLAASSATDPDKQCAGIMFPWKWRLTDRALRRSPGLLLRRYPHAVMHANTKSVVRLANALTMCQVHVPLADPGCILRDSDLRPVPDELVWTTTYKSDAGGHVNHYWSRSFEEFVDKKERGDVLALESGHFSRDYATYFSWTQPPARENLDPVPAHVIEATEAHIRRIMRLPGVAACVEEVEKSYRCRSDALARDPAMQRTYLEMLTQVPPTLQSADPAGAPAANLDDFG